MHSNPKTIADNNKLSAGLIAVLLLFLAACNSAAPVPMDTVVIAETPAQADVKQSELITQAILYAKANNGKLNDSVMLHELSLLERIYQEKDNQPLWSKSEAWEERADSLYAFLYLARTYGLFPTDYHIKSLLKIRNTVITDSLQRKNVALWARADLLYTDAFLTVARHLKLGRLPVDSVTLRTDSLITDDFFLQHFSTALQQNNIRGSLEALEPKYDGYVQLKQAIPAFLDSAVFKKYTYIAYPNRDSAALQKQLQKRLIEAGFGVIPNDTATIKEALTKYQKQKGFKVTGKVNEQTVRSLNNTDWEKFKRIAITLDRYKQLPDSMPEQYIWVNIPSYQLELKAGDTTAIVSRVVVGKPATRTPVLSSAITNMVTYPQWTMPNSIIVKEVLPGIKRNINYLTKRGYMLIDSKGEEVSPYAVDWSRYSKGIPYKVVQGSGDDNALGILKFNFNNKYSVYLHDTNQRYLFKNAVRALSHGCVRVQEWNKLARFILANDSINAIDTSGFIALETEWWHYSWPNNNDYEVLNLDFKVLLKAIKNKQ